MYNYSLRTIADFLVSAPNAGDREARQAQIERQLNIKRCDGHRKDG